jgi:hypothetical protein
VSQDPASGIVTYRTYYQIIADGHSSQSQIAFPSREQLSLLIEEAGLEVERWMGEWSGAPRSPQAAEIIRLLDFDKRADPMSFTRYGSLEGRTVIITGGASGIGAYFFRAFFENGAKVAFLDLQRETGAALADLLGECAARPLFVPCDLTDTAALRAAFGEIRAALGPAAVLVNNAANDQATSSTRSHRSNSTAR